MEELSQLPGDFPPTALQANGRDRTEDPQVGLPTIDELRCACGIEATWKAADAWGNARTALANGQFCLDCEAFYCTGCQARDAKLDANADSELCPTCNGTWAHAGFGAASVA